MRRSLIVGLLVGVLWASPGFSADHADGPAASADPVADVDDVYAWMSPDAQRLYLVATIGRNLAAGAQFSDSVQYVFHTESAPAFGGATAAPVDIICTFDSSQRIQCWAGDEAYVTGVASGTSGITSSDGRLRVFAGLRNDPFFFNLNGFRETARIVTGAASSLSFDDAGCPALDSATSTALVTQLQTEPGGAPATDEFANFNALAIAVSVDKSIVTAGGPIVGVWASTHRR